MKTVWLKSITVDVLLYVLCNIFLCDMKYPK